MDVGAWLVGTCGCSLAETELLLVPYDDEQTVLDTLW